MPGKKRPSKPGPGPAATKRTKQNNQPAFEIFVKEGDAERLRHVINKGGVNVNARLDGQPALCHAMANKHYDVAEVLVDSGCKVNVASDRCSDPLYLAVEAGNGNLVKKLLCAKGGKALATGPNRWRHSAATLAAEQGRMDILRTLVSAGVDINSGTSYHSALGAATKRGDTEMVKFLLENEADPGRSYDAIRNAITAGHGDVTTIILNACSSMDITEDHLLLAVRSGNSHVVQKLVDIYQDVEQLGSQLACAAVETGNVAVLEILITSGCKLGAVSGDKSPLGMAIQSKNLVIIRKLLDSGCHLNEYSGENEYIPLVTACEMGDLDLAKDLVSRGAMVNCEVLETQAKQTTHHTPLGAAAFSGNSQLMQFLCDHGADIKYCPRSNHTALYSACLGGHREAVSFLIKGGATLQATGKGKNMVSPLHAAILGDSFEVFKLLIDSGYPMTEPEMYHASLGEYRFTTSLAAERGNTDIVRYLLSNNAYTDIAGPRDPERSPPAIWLAAEKGGNEVVKILIESGCDVNAVDPRYGLTPIMAALAGYEASQNEPADDWIYGETLTYLLDAGCDVNKQGTVRKDTAIMHAIYALPDDNKLVREIAAKTDDITKPAPCPTVFRISPSRCLWEPMCQTPIRFAADVFKPATMKILIDCGANLENEPWWTSKNFYSLPSLGSRVKVQRELKKYNNQVHGRKKKK